MLKAIKKGFTLIEVAIAMAIVAVLTGAVAAVVQANATQAGNDVTAINDDTIDAQSVLDNLTLPTPQ